jgi:hypothetical protein
MAATVEIATAARDGKDDLVMKCIDKGANVDGYRDEVRPYHA